MNKGPLLELAMCSRSFVLGETIVQAMKEVSLTIMEGEFVAIMGQSGSGKTTLMNIIGCLDRPTSGAYRVAGIDVANLTSDELATLRRETFGFVFQRYNLLHNLTAAQNVEMPSIYGGAAASHRIERARALLAELGLAGREDHLPSQLSGGQQQRVSIARSLVNDPQVILADEPTGALDSKSGESVLALIAELHKRGRTIVLITHDENVAAHAQRIIRIKDGLIVDDSRGANTHDALPDSASKSVMPGLSLQAAIIESARMATHSLKSHLLRTAITLLGIVIGVAAVVIMLAIGSGSKQKIVSQISSMGTNLLVVRPGAPGIRGGGDIATLTPNDGIALSAIDNVDGVVPERSSRLTVRAGNADYQTQIQGVTEDFTWVREWDVQRGAFFTESDRLRSAPVAVLGETVRKNIFPNVENPVGSFIIVGAVPFQVIGVMTVRGASPMGTDQDDVVIIPVTTGLVRLFGKSYVNALTVKVRDVATISDTEEAIHSTLMARHRTEDFSIRNMASLLDTVSATQNTFTILLGSVAAISLLVGGIGVMNIMLVSVTERTREIGIRMATGARIRDILLQFNIESALVCAVGGILGVLIGFIVGFLVSLGGVAVLFSVWPAFVAFSCACTTGIVFGFLPARKAAHLDPVVALASE